MSISRPYEAEWRSNDLEPLDPVTARQRYLDERHHGVSNATIQSDGYRLKQFVQWYVLVSQTFSHAAMRVIEHLDVIWLDGDYIVKMFEIGRTTSVFSGIPG